MQPGCPLAGATPAGSVSCPAFLPSNKSLMILTRWPATPATPIQGLAHPARTGASPSSVGTDLHCQKGFSKWLLFVTLYWLFSSILGMYGLMLRFKSLSAGTCIMESERPVNTLNGVRDAFRLWSCLPRGLVTGVKLYLGPAQ